MSVKVIAHQAHGIDYNSHLFCYDLTNLTLRLFAANPNNFFGSELKPVKCYRTNLLECELLAESFQQCKS